MAMPASAAVDGGDPRLHHDVLPEKAMNSRNLRRLHDPNVQFEEYAYYAALTRAEEERLPGGRVGFKELIFPSKAGPSAMDTGSYTQGHELQPTKDSAHAEVFQTNGTEKGYKSGNSNSESPTGDERANSKYMHIGEDEWTNANRALRTATASAAFYLITTDILGPFGLPYAFASLGYGPGVALFSVFAGLAIYSGYLLWQIFMGMDSYRYPIKSYGDMGYRLYGNWLRILFNILQAIQLLLNVGLIVISNGEALSQAAKFRLCFAICCLIWAAAGFVLGQVKTLQKFGFLANAAVWINIIVMIVSIVGAGTSGPNYTASPLSAGAGIGTGESVAPVNGVYPSVEHFGNIPPSSTGFAGTVNGAMQAVFSYGGAMVFPEFMSEMRRPRDFLKGMWAAQVFIWLVYMFYGLFIYGFQGQYTLNPSYLGVSSYPVQTVGNVFAMVSALIAAGLYGNIGVKVLYNNIGVELFRAPPLESRSGRIAWTILIPIYWSIAFVVAAGIPDFSGLTGVVAAFCILHFTYTFPPLLSIAYLVNRNAALGETGFDPTTGAVSRRDHGIKRLMRGFFAQKWYMNILNFLYILGALALSGLGAYGSIVNMINAFAAGTVNSFVCHSPLDS